MCTVIYGQWHPFLQSPFVVGRGTPVCYSVRMAKCVVLLTPCFPLVNHMTFCKIDHRQREVPAKKWKALMLKVEFAVADNGMSGAPPLAIWEILHMQLEELSEGQLVHINEESGTGIKLHIERTLFHGIERANTKCWKLTQIWKGIQNSPKHRKDAHPVLHGVYEQKNSKHCPNYSW